MGGGGCEGTDPVEVLVRELFLGTEHLDCLKKCGTDLLSRDRSKSRQKRACATDVNLLEYVAEVLQIYLVVSRKKGVIPYGVKEHVRVNLRLGRDSGMWTCDTEGVFYCQWIFYDLLTYALATQVW
jgi:hypothetical protein